MSISVMLFATWILSTDCVDGGESSIVFLRLFLPTLGEVAGNNTGPSSGLTICIVEKLRRSPIKSGPNTIPSALYPIKSAVGSGLPCSSSRGAFSAARPIKHSSPKTAHIRSRRNWESTVPMARAISLALSLVCFVLGNSGSPFSRLWMATRPSNRDKEPRIPPGNPESRRLKVEATS